MIKIESSEKLFNEWKVLSYRLRDLGYIVQNDMELEKKIVLEWNNEVKKLIEDITNVKHKILKYIKDNNG